MQMRQIAKSLVDKHARRLQQQRQHCSLFFQSAYLSHDLGGWRHWLYGTVCEVEHALETNCVVRYRSVSPTRQVAELTSDL